MPAPSWRGPRGRWSVQPPDLIWALFGIVVVAVLLFSVRDGPGPTRSAT